MQLSAWKLEGEEEGDLIHQADRFNPSLPRFKRLGVAQKGGN
jgi:hypothetical protein